MWRCAKIDSRTDIFFWMGWYKGALRHAAVTMSDIVYACGILRFRIDEQLITTQAHKAHFTAFVRVQKRTF